ncbi:5-formyltetrahydrofolate cyclo-ligase [Carboxylicivirga sediminis]|uniref:5-formyltetrahydrofolate cyclo-ligase n=1 Tax=Carboxylicivirga sediminis TaxID=2006564 RepID=A0A941IY77_9BACT|nr:5-formyltetrahydrofolate cyclo-ligase [Carboxylicivirga sediminis]MBR8536204.1 5-formyltetrahydrofolate cyclo-ligase [Carboxylicivirga sediminis]
MIEKKELRRIIKQRKAELSDSQRTAQGDIIQQKLEASSIFQAANSILLYWAMSDEVPTQQLINKWYTQKKIYLPVINGDDLKIVRYQGEKSLVAGDKYGIPEPSGEAISNEKEIELVIVPGVAFDAANNRMGRGAGYYDRILKRIPGARKIGLAFAFQMVASVPIETHDIKMDEIINPL